VCARLVCATVQSRKGAFVKGDREGYQSLCSRSTAPAGYARAGFVNPPSVFELDLNMVPDVQYAMGNFRLSWLTLSVLILTTIQHQRGFMALKPAALKKLWLSLSVSSPWTFCYRCSFL